MKITIGIIRCLKSIVIAFYLFLFIPKDVEAVCLFERQFDDYETMQVRFVKKTFDGNLLLGGSKDGCDRAYLTKVNCSGVKLWEYSGKRTSDILTNSFEYNGKYFVCGMNYGTDDVPCTNSLAGFLYIFSENGDSLNLIEYNYEDGFDNIYIDTSSNDFFFVVGKSFWGGCDTSLIIKSDSVGNVTDSIKFGANIITASYMDDDGMIVAINNSIYLLDKNLSIVSDKIFSSQIIGISKQQSNYLVISTDSLFVLNFNLNIIERIKTVSNNKIIEAYNDNIILTNKYASGDSMLIAIYSYDGNNLNFQNKYTYYDFCPYNIVDMVVDSETIVIAGNKMFAKSFDFSGNTISYIPSLKILNASINITNYTLIYSSPIYGNEYRVFFKVNSTLHNTGNDTIHRFSLNLNYTLGQNCGAFHPFQIFNTSIPPGDTIDIAGGDFSKNLRDSSYLNFSIYLFGENNMIGSGCIELYPVSDYFVSINDKENQTKDLLIFPNPASNNIFIQMPANKSEYQLTLLNILGQKVRQLSFSGNQTEISVNDLPNGIYHLHIQDTVSGNKYWRKVVVEN
jgi:hypothetical protein